MAPPPPPRPPLELKNKMGENKRWKQNKKTQKEWKGKKKRYETHTWLLGTMSQTLELCSSSLSSFIHKSTKKKK
jgi:hypothetical protein